MAWPSEPTTIVKVCMFYNWCCLLYLKISINSILNINYINIICTLYIYIFRLAQQIEQSCRPTGEYWPVQPCSSTPQRSLTCHYTDEADRGRQAEALQKKVRFLYSGQDICHLVAVQRW